MSESLQAFRRVVERHQGALLAFARSLGLDEHAAEDVVQDAFLTAFARRAEFDPRRGTYRAWLYAIARNRALNDLRKKRPRPVPEPPEAEPRRVGDPHEPEAFLLFDRALARLPEEQWAAFVLAEIHGLSHAEVAAVEGIAPGTVKSRVARARARIRAVLKHPAETRT